MRQTQSSSTALGTAAVRAIESERPADVRICYDPFARNFTSALSYHLIKLFFRYGERRTQGALTFIACRQRYIDDCLSGALATSVSQVVILGAGFDSRAYRNDMGPARVFEVDHPASQGRKIQKLRTILEKLPAHVTYVPVDFDRETLDKLLDFGFDTRGRTFFLWEGVTQYLTRAAVDLTLNWIRTHAAPGSAVVFDYQHACEASRSRLGILMSRLSGETRAFGIPQEAISGFLSSRGFSQIVNVGPDQLMKRYCVGPNQGRKVPGIYSIVCAEVPAG